VDLIYLFIGQRSILGPIVNGKSQALITGRNLLPLVDIEEPYFIYQIPSCLPDQFVGPEAGKVRGNHQRHIPHHCWKSGKR